MIRENTLKRMLMQEGFVIAPGAYDALTAKIIEAQGFHAVYMTGFGTSVASFGLPDLGFLTLTEMVQQAARIADAVEIPVIADADTGYGNPMNVVRTVREYEKAGVAAIHIEDQQWPKRCGHMNGKKVIDMEDMAAKIMAAADARQNPDLLIIARTDSLAVEGFDKAMERARRYSEAGADILFIEALETREQMSAVPRLFPETPLLINMAPLTPNLSMEELKSMGYSLVILPGLCLVAAIAACNEEVQRFKGSGRQRDFSEMKQSFHELNGWLKAPYYMSLEQKYKSR